MIPIKTKIISLRPKLIPPSNGSFPRPTATLEKIKPKIKSENVSYDDDSDESSISENKDNSDNGKTSLADKVKHDLANINSKLIKKKSITKKRWWTPEEVIILFYNFFY